MGNDIKLTNIPCMPVGRMVDELSEAYCALINSGGQINMMPSVMLWGAPGVGKSQGVRQIAKEIERRTGKKTAVTDVRLLLFNPMTMSSKVCKSFYSISDFSLAL